jgi:hypothetical protein
MLNQLLNLLPTNILNQIQDVTFAELKKRGEIIDVVDLYDQTQGKCFYYYHLTIKIVVQPDFSAWYVYDGDNDPIEIGSDLTEAEALKSAQQWADWYLSGAWIEKEVEDPANSEENNV